MEHFFAQDSSTRSSFNKRIDEVNAQMAHRPPHHYP